MSGSDRKVASPSEERDPAIAAFAGYLSLSGDGPALEGASQQPWNRSISNEVLFACDWALPSRPRIGGSVLGAPVTTAAAAPLEAQEGYYLDWN